MKDLFSKQSKRYSRYRPTYPAALFNYILSFVKELDRAWDCATGNGQAAVEIAKHCKKVVATDISAAQVNNAVQKNNIEYVLCPAEKTPFENDIFDLITAAQAYHWFQQDIFCTEAKRVGKRDGIIAIWNYNLLHAGNETLNRIFQYFYYDITHAYWEPERKFVEDNYATLPFDFTPLPPKEFTTVLHWTKEDFTGYLNTWSAVQKYKQVHSANPVDIIADQVAEVYKKEKQITVTFPIYLRLGIIK